MFTAEDVLASALDQAPEFRAAPVDPEVMARAFNDALYELVEEMLDADAESLQAPHPVPASVVAQDPIDLTDDGEGTGARDWLHIDYIDWTDPEGPVDEVALVPVEARNRAAEEYEGRFVVGYLTHQQRHLKKLGSWEGVFALEVHGTLAPAKVGPRSLNTEFDYPRSIEGALKWDLVLWLAAHVGVADGRVARWEQRAAEARERVGLDATRPIGGRVESVVYQTEV